jgi:hypothetical protein
MGHAARIAIEAGLPEEMLSVEAALVNPSSIAQSIYSTIVVVRLSDLGISSGSELHKA